MKLKMNKDKWIILSLFILTISIRILFKNAGLFHWDSLKDAIVVEDMLKTGQMQYSYAYGAPGMVLFVYIFYWIQNLITGATSAEGAYFFATFLTTGLSVVFIYVLTKRITKNQFISVASSLLFSFNSIFLSVTTYPKTHSIALFFTLLSFYFMFLYNEKKRSWFLVLSGFCFGYSVSIRILNALMILPVLFIYLNPRIEGISIKLKKSKFKLRNVFWFIIPSLGIWYSLFLRKIGELGGFSNYLKSLFIEQGAAVGWQGLFSQSIKISSKYLYQSLSLVGTLLLILGLWYGYKRYKKTSIFLLLWIIPSFFYFANIAIPQARFFIIILPAISIYIAMGANYLYRKNKLIGILLVLIILISTFVSVYPIIKYRHNYSGTKELALWVKENTEENAVIMTNDIGFFIEYYGNRKTITHPRYGDGKEIEGFINKLINYSNNGIPIYSTEEGFAIDPGQKVITAIQNNFDLELVGEKESEIYQYSELELRKYNEKLIKFKRKSQ